jgi:putative transposase
MARLAPAPLHLSDQERADLHTLINRHSTAQQIALRGRIILLADEGKNHREIARELNISRDMARLWRQRWLERARTDRPVAERLADAPVPAAPPPLPSNKPCNCLRWHVKTQKTVDVPSVIGHRENWPMRW